MKILRKGYLGPLFWKLKAITEWNDTLYKLFLTAYLKYAVRRDNVLKLMLSQVAPGSVVYDIGAYIGLYSIILAQKIESTFIYSFEPNPQSYRTLVKNIGLMRIEECRSNTRNIALGAENGTRTLFISSRRARSSLYEHNAKYYNKKIICTSIVDCYNVDYLVESEICRPPDILKIDVEGCEYEVLCGARNTIASKFPQIFIEPHIGEDGRSNRNRIIDFLNQFGYKFKYLGNSIWCYKEVGRHFG